MLPLEDVSVLDLSRLAPGPYCTMVLGDLGADVLRVEQPGGGARQQREREAEGGDAEAKERREAAFNALLRNKRAIGLNLKDGAAREVFYALAGAADVVVEGFRPGVVKRLGVDYETLKGINPGIVYCSISGYGQDGPYRDLVGHDINYISFAGVLGAIGPDPDQPPTIPLNFLADYAGGGMLAATSILAALRVRDKTGKGQYVDISMTDGTVYLAARLFSEYLASGHPTERGRYWLSGASPYYNVYRCRDGKYISLGCNEPWFWENLCKVFGREDLIPVQWDRPRWPEMVREFREIMATRTQAEWVAEFEKTDIAYGKVYAQDEVFDDPQLQHRQMGIDAGEVNGETVRQVGIGPKLSETPGAVRSLGAPVGAHTDAVLSGLGYPEERIAELRAQGAVG